IDGNGHTIDANRIDRVLHVVSGVSTLTIDHTTIRGGQVPAVGLTTRMLGGGIFAQGTLQVDDSVITDNTARAQVCGQGCGWGGEGGGVYAGAVSLVDSAVTDNQAIRGGGIASGGTVRATRSSITGNEAFLGVGCGSCTVEGGGISSYTAEV